MTHVDTLISRGQSVARDLAAASRAIRGLQGQLDQQASSEHGSGDDARAWPLASEMVRLEHERWLRARLDKADLELERSIAAIDTLNAAIDGLPARATIDKVLGTLADIGVNLGVLSTRVATLRNRTGTLTRCAVAALPDGTHAEPLHTLGAALDDVLVELTGLADDHEALSCAADATWRFVARVRADEDSVIRHEGVETIGDLINFARPIRTALGHADEAAQWVEAMCRRHKDHAAARGFVAVAGTWGVVATHVALVRVFLAGVIADADRALEAIDKIPDLDNVQTAVDVLVEAGVSFVVIEGSLIHVKQSLRQAELSVPVDPGSTTDSAVEATHALSATLSATHRATSALAAFTSTHGDLVDTIDRTVRGTAARHLDFV